MKPPNYSAAKFKQKKFMISLFKNKYINSFLYLLLGSALIHTIILVFLSLREGNLYTLNYFHILSLDTLFSFNFNNFIWNSASVVLIVLIYILILKINGKSEK